MAGFDYRARMLPMIFTAPSFATFRLKYDKLDRDGSKKGSINEILDSDESIMQDQGNHAQKYPVDIYFTGDNYDLLADGFFTALSERYSQSDSGTLVHPRWGILDVFPMSWKQSESFVNGQGRANFHVEFIRVTPPGIFATLGLLVSQVVGLVELMEELNTQDFAKSSSPAVQAIGDAIGASLNTVTQSMTSLVSIHSDARDIISNISIEAQGLLSNPADNAELLISQLQSIVKLPMKFEDDTFTKLNSYSGMLSQLIIDSLNTGDVAADVRRNKALTYELTAGYAVAAQCAAALSTNYKTRESALSAIGILQNSYQEFNDAIQVATVSNSLASSFSGDHEFLGAIHDIHSKSISIILNDSFSLAVVASIVLSEASDAITLVGDHYGSLDQLDEFLESNTITDSEFLEIPVGREVKFYV